MSADSLFRAKSMTHVQSPDEINHLLEVTSAKGWIALVGIGTLIIAATGWSVTAQVPLTVSGSGILLKSGGIFEVSAATGGRLADLSVAVGDTVNEGQVIARLEQPQVSQELEEARLQLEHRRAEHRSLDAASTRELALQVKYQEQQTRHLQESIAALKESATFLSEKAGTQQQLVAAGRLTRQTVLTTYQQLDQVRERIGVQENELVQLSVQRQQVQAEHDRAVQASGAELQQAENEVAQLERSLAVATEVRTPFTGRIIELVVEQGSLISPAQPLLTLDLTGRTVSALEATLYIPARDGKRVQPGMSVQIAPATVRPEEYGYLLGTVTQVSSLPSTSAGMMRVLKNKELVAELAASGAPHEIRVALLPHSGTVSQYQWSSAKGPPITLQSGTLCNAVIAVDTRRPIELVMPFLRAAR